MADTAIDIHMENLKQLLSCTVRIVRGRNDIIEITIEELGILRTFLVDSEGIELNTMNMRM